jgi:hypothetical protein
MKKLRSYSISILLPIPLLAFTITMTSCGGSGSTGELSWFDPSPNYGDDSPPDGSPRDPGASPPVPGDEQGPDPFGFIMDWNNPDLIAANGAGIRHVCPIPWNVLMPDGANFDSEYLAMLDAAVRSTYDNGLEVFLRCRSGGYSGSDGFTAIQNVENWPIDTTDYSLPPHDGHKNGEWLGSVERAQSYPPKVLTRDTPGNTSPWYDYVYALASRYNGTTPDPERPNEYLPKVDYWALDGEEEMIGHWYGTATDLYGGVRGDPDVGTLPSLYRAVHAANPDAKVVGGSLTDGTILIYIVHEMKLEKGDYDYEMVQFADDWARQTEHLQFRNVPVLRSMMESQRYTHHRSFVDSLFAANKYYDILGYHMYSTYEDLDGLVLFYREKMAEYAFEKPLWGTETGIYDFPMDNHEIQAERVIKLLTLSLSEGVQHVTYSGLVESRLQFPFFYGLYSQALVPYRMLFRDSTPEQLNSLFGYVSRESFSFFAHTIKEKEYQFDRMIRQGNVELYVFQSGTAGTMFCVAWSDEEEASFDPRPELGIPLSAPLELFDYRGQPLMPSSKIAFSRAPVFLEWYE